MNPVGLLMTEHRLIERMISLIGREAANIEKGQKISPAFIDTTIDFIHTYADRTHHGKEEDILFRDMAKKGMSAEHTRLMDELVDEHNFARRNTMEMAEANGRYKQGEVSVLKGIAENFRNLANMYPKHIEKEEKIFFPASKTYLSPKELRDMLIKFLEFDRKMIHEKYKRVIEGLETA